MYEEKTADELRSIARGSEPGSFYSKAYASLARDELRRRGYEERNIPRFDRNNEIIRD